MTNNLHLNHKIKSNVLKKLFEGAISYSIFVFYCFILKLSLYKLIKPETIHSRVVQHSMTDWKYLSFYHCFDN